MPPIRKPKVSNEERRTRQADRLTTFRRRVLIGLELDDRGNTTPVPVGETLDMSVLEAAKLLIRHVREDDVALLEAVGARLGVHVPDQRRPAADTEG